MTTIVTRAGKGSPLTNTEMDTNLTNLNSYKVEQDISGNATITGDVYLTGSGKRITGDFSNTPVANRVMFQTSVVNGTTGVAAIPNGTGTAAAINAHNSSDPNNSSIAQLRATASAIEIISTNVGTGTYLPTTFYTSGSERMRIDTSGNVRVTSPAGLGYGAGAGGTVTQATSKSTAVTLNKPTGQVTMNNAALAAGASVTFQVNNSLADAADSVVCAVSGSSNYTVVSQGINNGLFILRVTNQSGGSLSDAIVLNFAIIKGATS